MLKPTPFYISASQVQTEQCILKWRTGMKTNTTSLPPCPALSTLLAKGDAMHHDATSKTTLTLDSKIVCVCVHERERERDFLAGRLLGIS